MFQLTDFWLTCLGWTVTIEAVVTPAGHFRVRLDHWTGLRVYGSGPLRL